MLEVQIADRHVPMLVDTRATYTCVNPDYASLLPMSGKFVKIWCSPEGTYIDHVGLDLQMHPKSECAKMYWLVDITEPMTKVFNQWEKYIRVQLPKATKPLSDYHCTMVFDPSRSAVFEEKWDEATQNVKVELITQYIVVGQQGAT